MRGGAAVGAFFGVLLALLFPSDLLIMQMVGISLVLGGACVGQWAIER